MLAVDRARIVLAANAALAWHCGWTPDDVLGRSVDTWLSLPVTWPAPGAETLATTCTVHRRAGGTVALAARVNAFAGSAAGAGWIIVLSAAG